MKITLSQTKWLNSRGGRTMKDVLEDEKGLYVLMSVGRNYNEKVYLPKPNVNNKKNRNRHGAQSDESRLKV